MKDKQADMNDARKLFLLLDYMKLSNHTIKEIGEKIGVSPNSLYYIRSTRRVSETMCFFIYEKIKECFPEDYAKIYEYYGEYLNRRIGW